MVLVAPRLGTPKGRGWGSPLPNHSLSRSGSTYRAPVRSAMRWICFDGSAEHEHSPVSPVVQSFGQMCAQCCFSLLKECRGDRGRLCRSARFRTGQNLPCAPTGDQSLSGLCGIPPTFGHACERLCPPAKGFL